MANTTNDPIWWTEKHSSRWDDVKAALERDWAQTKSDLSQGAGHQLNQGLGDTLKQAIGADAIPPLGVQTHPGAVTLTPGALAKERIRRGWDSASRTP